MIFYLLFQALTRHLLLQITVRLNCIQTQKKDKLHINISKAENTTLSIRITDMYGRELYAEKISAVAGSVNHDIDISKLAKGIYTIQLISDKGVSKAKFVKE